MKNRGLIRGLRVLVLLLAAPVPVSSATAADLSGIWSVSVTETMSVKKLGDESGNMITTLEFTPSGTAAGTWSYAAAGGSRSFAPGGTFALIGGKKVAMSFDAEGLAQLRDYLKDWALEWLASEGRTADGETLTVVLQSVVCKPMKIDKATGVPTPMTLKVKGLLTGPVDEVSAGRKLVYQAVFAFGAKVGIETQLTDAANWQVIATFDQKDTSGSPTYATDGRRGRGRAEAGSGLAAKEIGNRTYTANGLVTEWLSQLYADESIVVAGSGMHGFSHIAPADLTNPRGKVCNYRGRDSRDAAQRFGLSGFAKNAFDGNVYAWYGRDIVEVRSKRIVFENAPDYTHGSFGCMPKDRFVSDERGDLWMERLT